MSDKNDTKIDYKSYALLVILSRDIFGYLFGGLIFLVIVEIFFQYVSKISQIATFGQSEVLSVAFVLAIAHPTGRLLFIIGFYVSELFPWNEFEKIYKDELKRILCNLNIEKEGIKIGGHSINLEKPENIRLTIGFIGVRRIYIKHPSLYFIHISRPNVLRILTETTLGIICLTIAVLVYKSFESVYSIETYIIMGLLFVIMSFSVHRIRNYVVLSEIAACLALGELKNLESIEEKDNNSQNISD